jgi:hypothetical protein
MMQSFCFYIGLMRQFGSVKPSYKTVNAVCANTRAPSFAAFKFRHAQKSSRFVACMCPFLVLDVARRQNISKVAKRIVSGVAVNVVNVAGRPFARHVKPRQTTGSVSSFVNPNDCVPFGLDVPSNRARNNFTTRFDAPSKAACFWVVVQQCVQLVKCDVKMAHATILP